MSKIFILMHMSILHEGENSVDPDELTSKKPADLHLHSF